MNEVEVQEIKFMAKGSLENGVLFMRHGQRQFLRADTVVIAAGFEAEQSLYGQINKLPAFKSFIIGNAKHPRNILHAIHEGFEAGYTV